MTTAHAPLCQRLGRDQVAAVVHHFYQRVLRDDRLAPFFVAIQDWPQHEAFITDFWWGVMGGQVAHPRPGAMLSGHRGLGISGAAMGRWLTLFGESIDALLPATEAQQWQAMARAIAAMMGEHGLVDGEGE